MISNFAKIEIKLSHLKEKTYKFLSSKFSSWLEILSPEKNRYKEKINSIPISRHDSNNFNALSVPDLIDVLKGLQNKLISLANCQRFRTPCIFDALAVSETDHNIKVFNVVKDFISSKKQKNSEFLKKLKAIHQCYELELKNLDLVLRKENEISYINDKSRPKRPSKSVRNATIKASLVSSSQ